MTFTGVMERARAAGDYSELIQVIPYAQLIGLELFSFENKQPVFRLPKNDSNIGNPILPAIHGGVIGGFMELAGAIHLLATMETIAMPKIVDFSLDYLRAGKHQDTYASCQVWRQGSRVANVAINAWQTSEKEPIATARAHFLLVAES